MTRIALVVSDVDGTLVTKDKILTDGAERAVRRLEDSRHRLHHHLQPPDHRHAVSDRAASDHVADRRLQRQFDRRSAIEPDRAASDPGIGGASAASICLNEFGVDIWLFTNDQWLDPQRRRRIRSA